MCLIVRALTLPKMFWNLHKLNYIIAAFGSLCVINAPYDNLV